MDRFFNSVKGRTLIVILAVIIICIPVILTSYSTLDYYAEESSSNSTLDLVSEKLRENVQVLFEELLATNYETIESNTYLITDRFIERIEPNTDISEFSRKFNRTDFIVTLDNEEINEGIVKTGMNLTINDESYTLIVKGDVNKDGLLNYVDTSMIINNSKLSELDELSLLASDINEDGFVNREDVLCSIEYIFNGTLDIIEIDKVTAPTLEIVEGIKGSDNWYEGSVTVKFNSNGVDYGAYRVVGSKNETVYDVTDGTLIKLHGGAYKIIAWNYTEDGNKSNSVSTVLKIDEVEKFRCTFEEDKLYLREYLNSVDENTDLVIPATYYGVMVYGVGSDAEVAMESMAIEMSSRAITNMVHKNIFGDDLFDADLDEFVNFTIINSLTIENGIKEIGRTSFAALKVKTGDLIIPNSVEYIGDMAFAWNMNQSDVSNLYISENTKYIGTAAFGLNKISNGLVIPDNVEYIGEEAFASTDIRGDVIFNTDKISVISDYMFSGAVISGNVKVPDGVLEIGYDSFYNVVINGNLELGNNTLIIGDHAINGALIGGNLVLGNKLTTIGYRAFIEAELKTGDLIIPDTVISIGEEAFYGFIAPNSKLILGSSLKRIEKNAFKNSSFIGDLIIPGSVELIGDYAFCNNSFNGELKYDGVLSNVGKYAFANNPNLSGTVNVDATVDSTAFNNTGVIVISNE